MIDFLAWLQTFSANVLIGAGHGWAWLLLATGCLTWAAIGWKARLGGRRIWWLMVGNLLTAASAVHNWWRLE